MVRRVHRARVARVGRVVLAARVRVDSRGRGERRAVGAGEAGVEVKRVATVKDRSDCSRCSRA